MKHVLLLCLAVCSFNAQGQEVEHVINAEKRFARYAEEHNTRDAFLQFLDSTAVVFKDGNILQAKDVFSQMNPSGAKLTWQPAFTGIARTGDIGFTTGPWQVRLTMQDSVLETGSFSTIWKKTTAGDWKVIVDMGVNHRQRSPATDKTITLATAKTGDENTADPMKIENDFLAQLASKGSRAFAAHVHKDCWLNVEGFEPVISAKHIRKYIGSPKGDAQYAPISGGISSGKDLAYVYGTSDMNGKTENYLRVWQKDKRGWKIVMMTGPVPR